MLRLRLSLSFLSLSHTHVLFPFPLPPLIFLLLSFPSFSLPLLCPWRGNDHLSVVCLSFRSLHLIAPSLLVSCTSFFLFCSFLLTVTLCAHFIYLSVLELSWIFKWKRPCLELSWISYFQPSRELVCSFRFSGSSPLVRKSSYSPVRYKDFWALENPDSEKLVSLHFSKVNRTGKSWQIILL